ncbi:uncharacterized protein NPIL_10661 [Nephila pilipes]|uniref:Uncharacterized protein n=1 Tax=Nephila pilipes TaxID=299642 RepID=A0A8X6TUL3_NEPPI|nr:uncharacterized protein NPIL_10661 [Nephila pilipes]
MSAVMPNEVFSQSDLETVQGSSQYSTNDQSVADLNKSNSSPPIQTSASGAETVDDSNSSEEFTLAVDCPQLLNSVPEVPGTPTISEQSRERTDESIDDTNLSPELWRNGYCGQSTGFLGCLRDYSRKQRNSKLMLVILFFLLALPISAGYMGSRYMESCSMSPDLPIITFLMGILGFILIVCRMVTLGIRRFRCLDRRNEQTTLTITGIFLIASLSLTEMAILLTKTPVFVNPVSTDFCDRIFYNYVFYMNFALMGTAIIATLLHIPGNRLCSADAQVNQVPVLMNF